MEKNLLDYYSARIVIVHRKILLRAGCNLYQEKPAVNQTAKKQKLNNLRSKFESSSSAMVEDVIESRLIEISRAEEGARSKYDGIMKDINESHLRKKLVSCLFLLLIWVRLIGGLSSV